MARAPTIERDIVCPIVKAIDGLGGQVEGYLDDVGLINDWLDPRTTSLPEAHVWELFELAAQTMHMPALGLQAGATLQISDLGPFGRQLEQCLTLYHCLEEYIGQVNQFSSHAKFWLDENEKGFWFCRHGIDLINVGCEHVEQFTLQIMIRVLQLAAGRDWFPARIRVQTHVAESYCEYDAFDSIDIECSQRSTGVWIPRFLMSKVIRRKDSDPIIRLMRKNALIQMGQQDLNLDDISESLGYSKRTLQRLLSLHGLDWRRLLDQIRLQRAVELLESNELTLIQLSHELGYTDQANFGRAFRRWTGTSPNTYRCLQIEK